MYNKILVCLENNQTDKTIIPHVAKLATLHGSQLMLLHVADGWAARNFDRLKLAESEEMQADREYLESVAHALNSHGLTVEVRLAMGSPPKEIVRIALEEQCNLIAMTTHGHRFFGDIFHGSTIREVRHSTSLPLLLVRGVRG